MNREQFIKTIIRSTILAGMAAMIAVFIKQDKIGVSSECGNDFQCKKCNKVKGCTLPEAKNFRKNA